MKTVIFLFSAILFALPTHAETVQRIIDGDSLILDSGENIRLYGIDCPELKTAAGKRARRYVSSLIRIDDKVTVIRIKKDQYKRTVAIVLLSNGDVLQQRIVRAKHGKVVPKYCTLDICDEWK